MLKKILINLRKEYNLRKYKKLKNVFDKTNNFGKNVRLANTKWGKYSQVNYDTNIYSTSVGNYVNISWNVTIGPRSHIYKNFTTHDFIYQNQEEKYPIDSLPFDGYFNKIGHDVWIGCNVVILPGVEIGNGAIVAAGSVVTKSVPSYFIVAGNPAKIIKRRFTDEQISKLEEIKWYLTDVEEVKKLKEKLQTLVNFNLDLYNQEQYVKKKMMN